MKFVYVLISNSDDYLGEKCIISLFSLRRFHANDVEIYTDESTVESIPETVNRLKVLGANIKIETLPSELNQVQRSRFLKTSMRQRIKGDFVFLDLDTVIVGDLNGLESMDCDMAMALQHDCLDNDYDASKKRLIKYNIHKKVNNDETYGITKFFNSGVILYKDTPTCHRISEIWHSFWLESSTKYGWHYDQTDLDRTNVLLNNKITTLDGIYNCQLIGFRYSMSYLSDCKILHYFNNPDKLSFLEIKQPKYLEWIRKSADFIMIENTINNLKREYVNGLHIMENSHFDCLKRKMDKYGELQAFLQYPVRYPINRIINKFPFLRRQVDLLRNKSNH